MSSSICVTAFLLPMQAPLMSDSQTLEPRGGFPPRDEVIRTTKGNIGRGMSNP